MEINISPFNKKTSKKTQIKIMFNLISKRYDILNRIITFGLDLRWRKNLVNKIKPQNPKIILDVATGTGDLAIELSKTNAEKIIGIDISDQMIEIAKKKIRKKNLNSLIKILKSNSENMNFKNDYFDMVTVSYGVRNFDNLNKGLSEIFRVLKPSGKIYILETSLPKSPILLFFYKFYVRIITSIIGILFSNYKLPYKYLLNSASIFPFGDDFNNILIKNGFINVKNESQILGVSTIYFASKP